MTQFVLYEPERQVAHFLLTSPSNSFKKRHQIAVFVRNESDREVVRDLVEGEEVRIQIENSPKGCVAGITLVGLERLTTTE